MDGYFRDETMEQYASGIEIAPLQGRKALKAIFFEAFYKQLATLSSDRGVVGNAKSLKNMRPQFVAVLFTISKDACPYKIEAENSPPLFCPMGKTTLDT